MNYLHFSLPWCRVNILILTSFGLFLLRVKNGWGGGGFGYSHHHPNVVESTTFTRVVDVEFEEQPSQFQ